MLRKSCNPCHLSTQNKETEEQPGHNSHIHPAHKPGEFQDRRGSSRGITNKNRVSRRTQQRDEEDVEDFVPEAEEQGTQSILIKYSGSPKKQKASQVLKMMGGLHEKYRSMGDVSVQLRQRHRIDID